MEKIELTLKNTKLKSYHLISWILVFLNLLAQLFITFADAYRHDRFIIIILLSLALLFLFAGKGHHYNFRDKKEYIGTMYALTCIAWVKWELYIPLVLTILFYLLYFYSIRKFDVIVSKENIIYPSFPRKTIEWKELQNMVLKDGLLTIDFRNNKLLQQETEGDDTINEKEFNEFCREQLSK